MREGAVVLVALPQADGALKNRPALVLRELPGYGDLLICGISTQVHQCVPDFDEILDERQSDFRTSGLLQASLIRLGFLYATPRRKVLGAIGSISIERHNRLVKRLADYLMRVGPAFGSKR
jgi:mRNA interferase MazF